MSSSCKVDSVLYVCMYEVLGSVILSNSDCHSYVHYSASFLTHGLRL